jgi:histidine ammonia-lyase
VVENEINAVTDNPTIFPKENLIVSAGNFHGQPLALVLDHLAIALAELGSISERRVYKLISGQRGLPPFLTPNPGLNSGFMIPQYTAASIVSRNKGLCTPASVDTIDSSNGQEDHVSMGANAAVKAMEVCQNVETLLGIEAVVAAQAFELGGSGKTSSQLQTVFDRIRRDVPLVTDDVFLQPLLASGRKVIVQSTPPEGVQ